MRLIPQHMLWTASGCFTAESHSALKFCELCIILAGTIQNFLTWVSKLQAAL